MPMYLLLYLIMIRIMRKWHKIKMTYLRGTDLKPGIVCVR